MIGRVTENLFKIESLKKRKQKKRQKSDKEESPDLAGHSQNQEQLEEEVIDREEAKKILQALKSDPYYSEKQINFEFNDRNSIKIVSSSGAILNILSFSQAKHLVNKLKENEQDKKATIGGILNISC